MTWSYFVAGIVEMLDGQFNQAVELLRKGFTLEPTPFMKWWIAKGLAYNNELKEACELLKSVSIEAQGTHWAQMALFFMNAIQGEVSMALEVITEDLVKMMKDDEFYTLWTAESYALIGRKEVSIKWIERSIDSHFINYPFLLEKDPFLENIRNEPSFKKLMERVKYEWENFEV